MQQLAKSEASCAVLELTSKFEHALWPELRFSAMLVNTCYILLHTLQGRCAEETALYYESESWLQHLTRYFNVWNPT